MIDAEKNGEVLSPNVKSEENEEVNSQEHQEQIMLKQIRDDLIEVLEQFSEHK